MIKGYVFLILILSFKAFSQATSCCPLNKEISEILKEDEVVRSCILCKKFKTEDLNDAYQIDLADDDGLINADDQARSKLCATSQSNTLQSAKDLITYIVKEEKLIPQKQTFMSYLVLLAHKHNLKGDIDAKTVDPNNVLPEEKCENKETHAQIKKDKTLNEEHKDLFLLNNLILSYHSIESNCLRVYKLKKEEKEIIDLAKSLRDVLEKKYE